MGYATSAGLQDVYFNLERDQALELEITFEVKPSSGKVWLEFWFQTIDERVLQFIRDFKPYRDKLASQVGRQVLGGFRWMGCRCRRSST